MYSGNFDILYTARFSYTLAINLMTSLVAFSWCGTPQSQTIVVKVVMELSTKLTLSLTPSNMRMNVKQLRPQSAVFCQVNKQKRIYNFFIFSSLDQEKAVVKTEFQYKNCCNDRQGSFEKYFHCIFYSFLKGYPE